MSAETYILHPLTFREHLNNCQFQLVNVQGYYQLYEDKSSKLGLQAAHQKARCLLDSVEALVAQLEAEVRHLNSKGEHAEKGAA